MAVLIKNAVAIVYPVLQAANASNVAENPAPGASVSIPVYFEEATPSEVLIDYGVQLRQPAYLQCELSEASNFSSQALVKIQLNGVTYPAGDFYQEYVCQGNPENHRVPGFSDADHTDVLLELLEYAQQGV